MSASATQGGHSELLQSCCSGLDALAVDTHISFLRYKMTRISQGTAEIFCLYVVVGYRLQWKGGRCGHYVKELRRPYADHTLAKRKLYERPLHEWPCASRLRRGLYNATLQTTLRPLK